MLWAAMPFFEFLRPVLSCVGIDAMNEVSTQVIRAVWTTQIVIIAYLALFVYLFAFLVHVDTRSRIDSDFDHTILCSTHC